MKIALLGDIGLLGAYSLKTNPKLIEQLQEISEFLHKFDYVVGNLETPFSYKKKTWGAKSAYICTDPINVDVLKALLINAVTIANNHMYDFGKEGFETTCKLLDEAGIEWFGANGRELKIESGGNRLAFNGFCCYSTNPLKISSRYGNYGINRFNIEEVATIMRQNHDDGYLNILAVHSGIEHVNRPSVEQIKAVRLLGDVVPYLWYGHHPHVVQGIDSYNGSIIAHSLGNFCFAGNTADKNRPVIELSENNRRGMILEVEIQNNILVGYNPILIHIGEDGHISINKDSHAVNEFSEYLNTALSDIESYNAARIKQRNEYLATRKQLRDFMWVMKRLRPRYVKLLYDNHMNEKKYRDNVLSFLK